MSDTSPSAILKASPLLVRILETHLDPACVLEDDGRIVCCNEPFKRLTGWPSQPLEGHERPRCSDLMALSICATACILHKAKNQNKTVQAGPVNGKPAAGPGSVFWVTAAPLGGGLFLEIYRQDPTRRITNTQKPQITEPFSQREHLEKLVQTRTTELRKANKELVRARAMVIHQETMSSLGRLVAGIAHELNNPISFVYGNTDFIEGYFNSLFRLIDLYDKILSTREVIEHSSFRERVEALKAELDYDYLREDACRLTRSIRYGAERTRAIVRDLKTFSRPDSGELVPCDLIQGIESALSLLSPLIEGRIQVVRQFEPLPPVVCHAGNINQLFMNILTNAAEAIEGKGEIAIRARKTEEGVRIIFKDSGPGIDPAHLDRLFEPFFTTKPVGKGTGLGLSICEGIVRSHGGRIGVESQPGAGAIFVVELLLRPPVNLWKAFEL